ncbi:MAG: phosphoribosylglycinamide formyltransferase [Fluviibacter phosphoraccumulans]
MAQNRKTRCVVLISGRGTNLSAILQAAAQADYPAEIVAVISNKPDATGLQLAQEAGIHTEVVPSKGVTDREIYDQSLRAAIDRHNPDLVILAGFMRILTPDFVAHYADRMINIHPSLLPAFTGLHTHQRALDAGVHIHGCTVHFVTAELDHGPMIVQAAVPVYADDDASQLAARVLKEEHRIYPAAVRWFAEGRLSVVGQRVLLSNEDSTPNALIAPSLG